MQHGTYWERFQKESFSFIELNYALVQAYDFLHLYRAEGCILQIGGNDQWFNILSGRDLIRRADGGEAFALTMPLITTSSGEKYRQVGRQRACGSIPTQTSPYEYYQYWRNTEDADVGRFLRMFTFLPLDEIAEWERKSRRRPQRRQGGARLRGHAHHPRRGRGAQGPGDFARLVRRPGRPRLARTWSSRLPRAWKSVLVAAGLVDSLSEAKRQIRQGGVRLNGEPQGRDRLVEPSELPLLLSLGKRKVQLVAG